MDGDNDSISNLQTDSSDEFLSESKLVKRPQRTQAKKRTKLELDDDDDDDVKMKVEPKPASKLSVPRYKCPAEEILENEHLEIFGEEPSEVDDLHIPCRTLDDFVIYDVARNNQIVSIEEIDEEGRELRASGNVQAIMVSDDGPRDGGNVIEEEDDDEDFEIDENGDLNQTAPSRSQRVKLSTIFYWEVQLLDNGMSAIWLRTQYSWYKLVRPTEKYERFYIDIFKRIRLANLLITKMVNNTTATYQDFLSSMNQSPVGSSNSDDIGVRFYEQDIINNIDYICEEINVYLEDQDDYTIFNSPLLHKLTEIRNQDEGIGMVREPKPIDVRDSATRKTIRKIKKSEPEENPACVTSHIRNLAKGLFTRHIVMSKHLADVVAEIEEVKKTGDSSIIEDAVVEVIPQKRRGNLCKDKKVSWIGESVGSLRSKTYYSGAQIGEVELAIGDCVALDTRATEPDLVKIQYMYQDTFGVKYIHGRTLMSGKKTVLEDVSHPFELFLVDQCDTWKMSSIVKKCELKFLEPEEVEPQQQPHPDFYFIRYWYDPLSPTFEDIAKHELLPNGGKKLKRCYACDLERLEESKKFPHSVNKKGVRGFVFKGYEYHLYDFVYLLPSAPYGPYDIGQIVEILSSQEDMSDLSTVKIRRLARCDTLLPKYTSKTPQTNFDRKDARQLYITEQYVTVNIAKLEGTCWVQHQDTISDLDAYKDQVDTFYISGHRAHISGKEPLEDIRASSIRICGACQSARDTNERHAKRLQRKRKPLAALDIFSGCGGLTCGLKQSGVVETKYAIEFYSSAALSFERNFPGANVYNQCANLLLDRAIAVHHRGEELPPIKDHMNRVMPEMPAPQDVDFIYCGPPCQGFSGINRYKKANDIKNSLIATSLSYVDYYRPEYFLLENVRGMLAFKLGGEQDGTNRIKGGIKMGVVKFILRALTSMGYQTRFSVQQAGHHGLPQSRRRLFFWGAKRGSNLPEFPQPSNCFPKQGTLNINLPNGKSFTAIKRTIGHAPHFPVTVADAICDLPGFEYRNPEAVYKVEDPRPSIFKKLPVASGGYIGSMEMDYTNPPLTEYQRQLRRNAHKLHNHVTRGFNDLTTERICRVPMWAGADHSNLPEKLKPWCLSSPDSAASRHNGWKGLFGRLDFDGHFQTALTDMQPMGKQGTVIHPNQERVLTVRECARAQGFPDDFIFHSFNKQDVKDLHRQVGNAVPPPLAAALGRQLKAALMEALTDESESDDEEPPED
ncbi:S-adenosyl-L-methionine-dependent methyltransferase [Basidiobolus meristosporus CBS 931.73]|uniref:Cytosine-specific methyltransferase n=1 Tax=Basidiobolus meristosporus CBS 931.73 TaxID=1314790 RepID=A0A1Y1YP97_9FUNG|nr:S-adenosyl-L-methionine-dependent methyltransferase [Basidiobolus meristosporus CBS 931.73]|eukprot:ORX99839.1 S-adenosyl-L-methionine-dependent methyltransferase [Basidiobolus meristosporus CBS 931.73]